MRIRDLQNELEEPWCCVDGLAPIKGTCTAVMLCFLNIILPGFGTIISGCIEKSSDPNADSDVKKVAPDDEEENFDDDEEEAKKKEE